MTDDTPGLTDVPGFFCAGVAADVRGKGDGRIDLALVYSQAACSAAGVFTTNDIKAAPVLLDQEVLSTGEPFHGIVVNSGNANACTGQQGMADARALQSAAEAATGAVAQSFFVCSTGRIGRPLPMARLLPAIDAAGQQLGSAAAQGQAAAEAILTSDTRPKTATAHCRVGETTVTLAGMAKGAGMIEPNMATMLAFITTDARVSSQGLQVMLAEANSRTFNAITVDGDMSTNDTVLVLANGASGVDLDADKAAHACFADALEAILQTLALKIAGDGERITKLVQLEILNAGSTTAAEKVARAIGNSLLVKTSWYGSDPNWGRVIDAAGYARIGLREASIDMAYATGLAAQVPASWVPVLQQGEPIEARLPEWRQIVREKTFSIQLNLNLGPGDYRLFATDLSEGYVDFNKSE